MFPQWWGGYLDNIENHTEHILIFVWLKSYLERNTCMYYGIYSYLENVSICSYDHTHIHSEANMCCGILVAAIVLPEMLESDGVVLFHCHDLDI